MPAKKMVAIDGSEKHPIPNARVVGATPPDERLEVTVRLRPRTPFPDPTTMLQPSPDRCRSYAPGIQRPI